MMGAKGTPIEGVKTSKSFTLKELDRLAKRFDLGSDWVRLQLKYIDRTLLSEWLFADLEDSDIPKGSIRKADHLHQFELMMEVERFKTALGFHGARWVTMDAQSEKRAGEDLNLLLLIEGSSAAGWVVPPKFITVTMKSGRAATKPVEPVAFDLAQWKKRGWERNVLFEGDRLPPPKEGERREETPINSLCTALSVHIEDLERTISQAVLFTQEEPWVPIEYRREKFQIGMHIPKPVRDRIVETELGVDMALPHDELPEDVKVA